MKNPLECHGTLTKAPCGCLVNAEFNPPVCVERSEICHDKAHAPVRISYRKAKNDKAAQVKMTLTGKAD